MMNTRIPPPLVMLACAMLMWGLDKALPGARANMPLQSWLAGLFALVGLTFMLLAAWQMFRARTTVNPFRPHKSSVLVTAGVFALSRNPIYLGDLLLLTAWVLWLGNAVAAPLLGVFVLFITRFQIRPEEQALQQRFGHAYREYCERVRRWL